MQQQITNSTGVHLETYQEHRKTARAIRDAELHDILKLSLGTLSTLMELASRQAQPLTQVQQQLLTRSLQLLHDCLNFDFLGTVSDESSDESGSWQIHCPVSWRETLSNSTTVELVWSIMFRESKSLQNGELPPPSQARVEQCMNVLVLFASVRRTLFVDEQQRSAYCERLCAGVSLLFTQYAPLLSSDNASVFHYTWMLLARLKTNYSFLPDLCSMPHFGDLINMLGKVSTTSGLGRWQTTNNTIHYMCHFWIKICLELPSLKASTNQDDSDRIASSDSDDSAAELAEYCAEQSPMSNKLRALKQQQALVAKHAPVIEYIDQQLISELLFAYIQGRMEAINHYIAEEDFEELNETVFGEVGLLDQLRFVPQLARHQLQRTRDWLKSKLDVLVDSYNKTVAKFAQNQATPADRLALQQQEGQLAFVIYILGAILGGAAQSNAQILGQSIECNCRLRAIFCNSALAQLGLIVRFRY